MLFICLSTVVHHLHKRWKPYLMLLVMLCIVYWSCWLEVISIANSMMFFILEKLISFIYVMSLLWVVWHSHVPRVIWRLKGPITYRRVAHQKLTNCCMWWMFCNWPLWMLWKATWVAHGLPTRAMLLLLVVFWAITIGHYMLYEYAFTCKLFHCVLMLRDGKEGLEATMWVCLGGQVVLTLFAKN
jgi:hypothetical protein